MDAETAQILSKINKGFYQAYGASFSETRQAPWPGWRLCLDRVKDVWAGKEALSVFDLACGNLRFESFLASALPDAAVIFYAVDDCDGMVPAIPSVHYQSLDVLDVLQQGLSLGGRLAAPACDLSVSFGFMHHVPGQELRKEVLEGLVGKTRPQGYAIVSFWQFLNDAALGEKARAAHGHALEGLGLQGRGLDEGDYLLGWKNIPGAYRYCHSFSESDIDQLAASVAGKAAVAARFTSDGRTGNLNTYLILKAR